MTDILWEQFAILCRIAKQRDERSNLISLSQIHHLFFLKEFNGLLEAIRSDVK